MSPEQRALHAIVSQPKKDVNHFITQMKKLHKNINELEERYRRNNVRLINLPMGAEGNDLLGYQQQMLPTWIPRLKLPPGKLLEIDRAHCITPCFQES